MPRTGQLDLNSDLGESYGRWSLGDDAAMLDHITSANIACGFHAGDPSTLRRCCSWAAERGVNVGAQVGYPDLLGFGRRFIDIDPRELADAVTYQIGALAALARVAGTRVSYVKPHGALYHAVHDHEAQAAAVVRAVREYDPALPLLGAPGSRLLELAAAEGLTPVGEAFADRGYTPDGRLLTRDQAGAVITDPDEVSDRAVRMATSGEVVAVDGSVIELDARSICLHGDTSLDEVLGLYRRLEQEPPDGVVAVVPASRTLLLEIDPAVTTVGDVRRSLHGLDGTHDPLPPTREVAIPVTYDGEDLEEVAALTGLSVDEVVAAHTGQRWTVGFTGFAPGFGYLVGEDARLRVPRRAAPRRTVPAGAVALADGLSGIYPRASPGGWQLIGRTTVEVWDVHRDPPALLTPGTGVRFVAAS